MLKLELFPVSKLANEPDAQENNQNCEDWEVFCQKVVYVKTFKFAAVRAGPFPGRVHHVVSVVSTAPLSLREDFHTETNCRDREKFCLRFFRDRKIAPLRMSQHVRSAGMVL